MSFPKRKQEAVQRKRNTSDLSTLKNIFGSLLVEEVGKRSGRYYTPYPLSTDPQDQ